MGPLPVDQVEEREEEDPHQVHEVPVEPGVLEEPRVGGRSTASASPAADPENSPPPTSTWRAWSPVIVK